eukprot:jgi/Tetstr1/466710/TSEL_011183.t1
MEAVYDGYRFRWGYLRKSWDTQMHNGDTLALDTKNNLGSPKLFTELLELEKDRIYNENIASAAKMSARPHFNGGHRGDDCDRGMAAAASNHDSFKTARSALEAPAPRVAPAKDTAKYASKGNAKAEASVADNAE